MTGLDKVNKVSFISRVCCFFVWCCGVMIGPARALDLDRRTQPPSGEENCITLYFTVIILHLKLTFRPVLSMHEHFTR